VQSVFEHIPRAIVRFRKSLPDVDVSLRDMSTFEHIEALHAEKMDLGEDRISPLRRLKRPQAA
jgi:hypothetical protein